MGSKKVVISNKFQLILKEYASECDGNFFSTPHNFERF